MTLLTKFYTSLSLLLFSELGSFANVSAKDYDIQVKTGDRAFAGTDANIYLTIYGNEGTTTERRLNGLISGDAFERNSLDALTLVGLEDVGTLEKVKVRSDGSRFAPDWYLDWVSVDGQKATFNRWIEDAGSATADFDPTPSCMSGETGVMSAKARHQIALRSSQRHGSTVLKVKDLKINDVILGLDGNKEPASCTVEAVGNFGFGPVYGNYTDGHFVLNPETGVVEKHGSEQIMSIQDKYIVVTSCPLGVDEAGVGFTPFDSDFFGELTKEMTWKDYLLLHTAILRVVRETGSFWFHGSSYKDWTFLHQHATRMSKTMLKCMKDHNDCKDLEEASVVFIERALAEPAKKKAYEALHNIGQHRNLGSASAAVTGGRSVRK